MAVKQNVMEDDHGQTANKTGQDSPQLFHSLLRSEDHRGTNTKRQGDEHAFHPDDRRDAHEECSTEKFRRKGMIPEVAHQEPKCRYNQEEGEGHPRKQQPLQKDGRAGQKGRQKKIIEDTPLHHSIQGRGQ